MAALAALTVAVSTACGGSADGPPRVEGDAPGAAPVQVGARLPEQVYSPHVTEGQKHPPYNSRPATSGWHHSGLVRWGVHEVDIPDEFLLHNLEHGGVGIHYNCPEGCDALVGQLAGIAVLYNKIVMTPYAGMDSRIALTSWTYIDEFEEFDQKRVVGFIREHMGKPPAPEYSVPP